MNGRGNLPPSAHPTRSGRVVMSWTTQDGTLRASIRRDDGQHVNISLPHTLEPLEGRRVHLADGQWRLKARAAA